VYRGGETIDDWERLISGHESRMSQQVYVRMV
jgi:hypothetical protein